MKEIKQGSGPDAADPAAELCFVRSPPVHTEGIHMNLRFLALPAALAAVLALSGCANDNARYRADVYGPGSLNQAQAVKTVEILSVQTARIALPNETKNSAAQLAGTVAGAAAGMILGS